MTVQADEVIRFWFDELESADWWKKNPQLDQQIAERFAATYWAAVAGELYSWRATAPGRLAEIIVLDQFSRNMFRDQPQAFAHDGMAVVLSQEAIAREADHELDASRKAFMYMPLMHSESMLVHQQALQVFAQPGLENNLGFEKKHLAIIERFGRYPHRNKVLGRESTAEEIEFLKQPGSSF